MIPYRGRFKIGRTCGVCIIVGDTHCSTAGRGPVKTVCSSSSTYDSLQTLYSDAHPCMYVYTDRLLNHHYKCVPRNTIITSVHDYQFYGAEEALWSRRYDYLVMAPRRTFVCFLFLLRGSYFFYPVYFLGIFSGSRRHIADPESSQSVCCKQQYILLEQRLDYPSNGDWALQYQNQSIIVDRSVSSL